MEVQEKTIDWYKRYYAQQGRNRNDVIRNPGVLWQKLAYDAAVIKSISYCISRGPEFPKVLDVGCGAGGDLYNFLALGLLPSSIYGIDIQPERIAEAQNRYPNVNFQCGDARYMAFGDEAFDIVFESTMFVTLPDENIAGPIAKEMIRVCKPGGYIVLLDWKYSKPWNKQYLGLSDARTRLLFATKSRTARVKTLKGALIPPIGRGLSRFAPFLYFPIATLFPFLVGQRSIILQKTLI